MPREPLLTRESKPGIMFYAQIFRVVSPWVTKMSSCCVIVHGAKLQWTTSDFRFRLQFTLPWSECSKGFHSRVYTFC